jgi:transposase
MERKERRHHTREFKLEAVRLAAVGDKTKAKVARELGVRVNQLRQWRLDFEEEERNGVPRQELGAAEQDLGTLRRENARLREENEILKKAAVGSTIQCNTFVLMLHFREGGIYGSNGTPRSFRFSEVGALATVGGGPIA